MAKNEELEFKKKQVLACLPPTLTRPLCPRQRDIALFRTLLRKMTRAAATVVPMAVVLLTFLLIFSVRPTHTSPHAHPAPAAALAPSRSPEPRALAPSPEP